MTHGTAQFTAPERDFAIQLAPTRYSARLSRELAAMWLRTWDAPREVAETVTQLVGELAANAAVHGRVPGRDFLITLHLADDDRILRIEATDTRTERLPETQRQAPAPDEESGRGLLIVDTLADRWGVTDGPVPRKTVWAELDLAHQSTG
ncbi:ATP-binding protein [Streptomyces sp. MUM 178J]|uniref:ATP-binding protein n=1 Tax=Streptomyces sp. MUM 178J TaxID=2791991 RepID=UPI001F03EEC0|nr:ATP-binding protein [Streptomyces sp. MUM 178J]WRQ81923.1 ATP-binding protein [Streptomyces sp. MUM 178J]